MTVEGTTVSKVRRHWYRKAPLVVLAWLSVSLIGCGGAAPSQGSAAAANQGSSEQPSSQPAGPSGASRPTVTISTPSSSGSYTAPSSALAIAGSAAPNGSNITQVSWTNSLGGTGIANGTTSWSTSSVTLQNGTNVITVTARDAAGYTGTASLVVTYNGGAAGRTTYYISPSGSDSNDGRSLARPYKSFSKAFSAMIGGDELILLDGTYSDAAGTGYISDRGTRSGQPPSGPNLAKPTYVHALNPGNVTIQGALGLGTTTRKVSFATIQGITFDGGGSLYNTSYVTVKDCGFKGALGIGTNDHSMGNSYALLEDVWAWANERITFIVYRSDHVVVRRAVFRQDGCIVTGCSDPGNAVVGTSIYNSHDVSFQNVVVLDSVLGPNGFGGAGDFMATWHNNFFFPWHRNEWLGSMSINTQLGPSFFYDIDNLAAAQQPMATFKDIVAWNASAGFAANMNCGAGCAAHNITVQNATLKTNGNGDGVWINSNLTNGVIDIKNIVAFGGGNRGISTPQRPSYMNAHGFRTSYDQTTCATGCYTSDPTADGATPSIRYPHRVEATGFLKGKGQNGSDIGANIVFRYGADGTRHGEPGYNTLTTSPLWPWPNEDRIKREMCTGTTRGFCSTGQRLGNLGPMTLTTYIWELFNTPLPAGVYP